MKFSVHYDGEGKVLSYAEDDGEGEIPVGLSRLVFPYPIPDFVNLANGQVRYSVDVAKGELVEVKRNLPKAIGV